MCEQLGVEASAEIQAAARKVLDENKRLRELLRLKGVGDVEIDSFVPHVPTATSLNPTSPSAALINMMNTRKSCNAQALGRLSISSASSCGPLPTRTPLQPSVTTPTHQQHMHQQHTPIQAYPTNILPMSPQSVSPTGIAPPAMTAAITPPTTSFDPQTLPQAFPYFSNDAWQYSLSQSYMGDGNMGVSGMNGEDPGSTSCIQAANIIRSMSTSAGPDVEAALGCCPVSAGQDCKVPNSLVFEVMDRYSAR